MRAEKAAWGLSTALEAGERRGCDRPSELPGGAGRGAVRNGLSTTVRRTAVTGDGTGAGAGRTRAVGAGPSSVAAPGRDRGMEPDRGARAGEPLLLPVVAASAGSRLLRWAAELDWLRVLRMYPGSDSSCAACR